MTRFWLTDGAAPGKEPGRIFCRKGRRRFSPPEEQILPGITRKAVLSVAAKIGVSVEEKEIFWTI